MSLAIRVRPDRLFWTFLTWTPAIIPPRITSAFSGDARQLGHLVGAPAPASSAGVAGQGVARHVEAERPSSPRPAARRRAARGGRAGSGARRRARPSRRSTSKASKRLRWPRLRSSWLAWPACTARGRTASSWLRRAPRPSKAPALISVSTHAWRDRRQRDALEEVDEARERPPRLAGRDDRLDRLVADPLDRPQAEVRSSPRRRPGTRLDPRLTSGGRTSMPIRRQSSMCSTKTCRARRRRSRRRAAPP